MGKEKMPSVPILNCFWLKEICLLWPLLLVPHATGQSQWQDNLQARVTGETPSYDYWS